MDERRNKQNQYDEGSVLARANLLIEIVKLEIVAVSAQVSTGGALRTQLLSLAKCIGFAAH